MPSSRALLLALSLCRPAAAAEPRPSGTRLLRVMTYNVHSCKGWDRIVKPARVAAVIAKYKPDVVALQELRVSREGGGDQPAELARALGMSSHFFSVLRLKTQDYGIAVLSRYPMRLVREEELPLPPLRRPLEPRGALWLELEVDGVTVQLLDSHLGLNAQERALQAAALAGPRFMGDPAFKPPFVVCADLNSGPSAEPASLIAKGGAVDAAGPSAPATIPSLFPMLRIDHIFVSSGTAASLVPLERSFDERWASDHLPVIVDVALPAR